jgi:hypothetical protein
MYSGSGFEASELGDVDVIHAGGLYHLFHLVFPNHDYIAHAVSWDGRAGGAGRRTLPPPKEIVVNPEGRLLIRSFSGFSQKVSEKWEAPALFPVVRVISTPTSTHGANGTSCVFECRSGHEVYFLRPSTGRERRKVTTWSKLARPEGLNCGF